MENQIADQANEILRNDQENIFNENQIVDVDFRSNPDNTDFGLGLISPTIDELDQAVNFFHDNLIVQNDTQLNNEETTERSEETNEHGEETNEHLQDTPSQIESTQEVLRPAPVL